MRTRVIDEMLVVDLGQTLRCLSTAVLGGGRGKVRTWLNMQVPADYSRMDPAEDLSTRAADLAGPVIGMMTAASVSRFAVGEALGAKAWATTGVGHAVAAAGTRPRSLGTVGTINILVVAGQPLSETGLVCAVQTAVEAKAQALADARIPASNAFGWATGTPTDSICVATPGVRGQDFVGPATSVGAGIARSVYEAITESLRLNESQPATPTKEGLWNHVSRN